MNPLTTTAAANDADEFSTGIEELLREDDRLAQSEPAPIEPEPQVAPAQLPSQPQQSTQPAQPTQPQSTQPTQPATLACKNEPKYVQQPWYIACLERSDVLSMIVLAVVFLLLTMPPMVAMYKSFFPLFFDATELRYNTFGTLVAACLAAVVHAALMRAVA